MASETTARFHRDENSYQRFIAYVGEAGLEVRMRAICLKYAVTPRDVYLDSKGPSIVAARTEIWWWLATEYQKTYKEIGQLFDREPTSILYMLKKLRDRAAALGMPLHTPEEVHAAARAVAAETLEKLQKVGKNNAANFRRKTSDGEGS